MIKVRNKLLNSKVRTLLITDIHFYDRKTIVLGWYMETVKEKMSTL